MRSNWNLIHSWLIRLPFFLNVSFFFKESYFLLSYNISRHALRVYGQHVKSKMADQNEEDTSPAADIVVTKYKMAGDMVNGEGKINLISSLRNFSLIETRFSYLFIVHSTYKRAPTCHADLLTCAIAQRDTTSVKCW